MTRLRFWVLGDWLADTNKEPVYVVFPFLLIRVDGNI